MTAGYFSSTTDRLVTKAGNCRGGKRRGKKRTQQRAACAIKLNGAQTTVFKLTREGKVHNEIKREAGKSIGIRRRIGYDHGWQKGRGNVYLSRHISAALPAEAGAERCSCCSRPPLPITGRWSEWPHPTYYSDLRPSIFAPPGRISACEETLLLFHVGVPISVCCYLFIQVHVEK